MAVIVLALLIAPIIKYGIFVFEPGYLWPEIFVILTVYLLSFYIADLYNFESSFLSAAYLFSFFIRLLYRHGHHDGHRLFGPPVSAWDGASL